MPTYTPTYAALLRPGHEYELVTLPNGNLLLVPFAGESVELTQSRKESEMANDSNWPEYDPDTDEYWMQSAVTGRMHSGETSDECLNRCNEADRVWAEHQSRAHNRLTPATNAEGGQPEADHD